MRRGKHVPLVRLKIVREGAIRLPPSMSTLTADGAAYLAGQRIGGMDREAFLIITLDSRRRPTSMSLAAIGGLTKAYVAPSEVYSIALAARAASIVVVHNHPSGDPTPTREDLSVTQRLVEAGRLLGIPLMDHIILGDGEAYVSLRQKGVIR
ncbi:MAG: JAB domain-containing protein [Bacillota bacterium]